MAFTGTAARAASPAHSTYAGDEGPTATYTTKEKVTTGTSKYTKRASRFLKKAITSLECRRSATPAQEPHRIAESARPLHIEDAIFVENNGLSPTMYDSSPEPPPSPRSSPHYSSRAASSRGSSVGIEDTHSVQSRDWQYAPAAETSEVASRSQHPGILTALTHPITTRDWQYASAAETTSSRVVLPPALSADQHARLLAEQARRARDRKIADEDENFVDSRRDAEIEKLFDLADGEDIQGWMRGVEEDGLVGKGKGETTEKEEL